MSAVTAVRSRALSIPAWAWLTGIVVLSVAVRVALGRRIVAPWIMIDEIVYSELAKNLAAHGELLVRGVPSHGYGVVYPVLIAPAWALFTSIPSAYAAAKAINAAVMSLAAIPAYFLARRILGERLALAAAGLTVLVPGMLYTGVIMTENAFYPIFLVTALVLVAMLERPTAWRQVGLLALCALAFETRAQAVALFAAAATAPVLLGLVERRGLRGTIRPFAWFYGLLAAGAVLAVAGEAVRGRSPLALLGAYQAATSTSYTVGGILRFVVYHWAGLDLAIGVLPFAALLALWLAPRRPTPQARAFAVASLAISVWLVVEVAAFASANYVDRIEERNMFYLAPLGLIALLGLGVEGVVTRSRKVIVASAVIAGVLPVLHPVRPLHRHERAQRQLLPDAVVVGAGPPDPSESGALGRARSLPGGGCALRLPAATLRPAPPGARRCVLRPDLDRGRERPPRDPQRRGRLALGGHAHAARRLDRP